jgi:hypothetical protein
LTRVTIDDASRARLAQVTGCAEVCDASGATLGYFAPVQDPGLYEGVEPPLSEEELRRREQEPGGRALKDILADLEKRG